MEELSPWQQFKVVGHPTEPAADDSPWQQFLRGEDPWADAISWPPASPWEETPWQAFRAD